MARLTQYYDGAGVPLRIEGDAEDPARAWRSQRARVRTWLDSVPDSEWDRPTRCDVWDMTALVRHLASTLQYLGYTLHQGASGEPTTSLRDFDTHETVKVGMDMLGEKSPAEARAAMRGEQPPMVPLEAEVAVRYLIGLAAVATNGLVEVTGGSAPTDAPVIEADVVDLVDRATGRPTDGVRGDDRALTVLDGFGALLAT